MEFRKMLMITLYAEYNMFLKIKIIKKRKKKNRRRKKAGGGGGENSTELQKPNVEAQVYNNNRKCD